MTVSGVLTAPAAGTFTLRTGADMRVRGRIGGVEVASDDGRDDGRDGNDRRGDHRHGWRR